MQNTTMNPFDDFEYAQPANTNFNTSRTQCTSANSNKTSREAQLEAELVQTNAIIKKLEEKINALEGRLCNVETQYVPRLSIISYKNKLFNLACEEILFYNEMISNYNEFKVFPATIYLGGILFDEIHSCINYNLTPQVLSRKNQKSGKPEQFIGENTIEFIRQFTNITRVIIHINQDPHSSCGHNASREMDNIIYAILNVISFKNGYDIIIKGRYAATFHNKLLTELLKLNNYQRVEFDVDQTKLNGTYCDYWKLSMINGYNGRKLIKELQAHCEKNNIGFATNIM